MILAAKVEALWKSVAHYTDFSEMEGFTSSANSMAVRGRPVLSLVALTEFSSRTHGVNAEEHALRIMMIIMMYEVCSSVVSYDCVE